jgi:PAS domain S-box-containing protein
MSISTEVPVSGGLDDRSFYAAPVAMLLLDADARVQQANEAFRLHHGAPPVDATFWPAREPAERVARSAFLAELRLRGAADAVATLPDALGRAVRVHVSGRAVSGGSPFMVALGRAEETSCAPWTEALREAHERLERAVSGSRDGVWDWDVVHDRVFLSPRWKEMLGYRADEIESSIAAWVSLLHPDDAEVTQARVKAALDDPNVEYTNEFRIRHKDGSWRWILARAAVGRDEHGNALVMSGSHVDVTERREAELEASRQRALLSRVIDSIPNLVFLKDRRGNFVLVNSAVAKIFGAPKESIVRRNNADVHENLDDLALYESIEAMVLRERKAVVADETFAGKDGIERRYVTTKTPIEGPDGELMVLGTSVDVTESKRVEAELRAAKETAEAATRAKTAFVATMSHEIRTPLNGMIGTTDLLLASDLLHDTDRELARLARRCADTLLGIVDDVLDFSRIEEGRLELEQVPLRIDEIASEVLELVSRQAEQKGLELVSTMGPHLGRTVLGDPLRLRQILLNLASNAVKFTGAGEVAVRARVTGNDGQTMRVRFEVTDTGEGIAAEVVPRLFNSFTQADSSTTRRHGGSGLGLAISKRLVEMMGGTIGVFSTEGVGSTFWFVVPFTLEHHANDSAPRSARGGLAPLAPVRRALAGPNEASKPRVLVAEDNPVNQLVMARMLELLGYSVDLVADGAEAVTCARQASYACILMDCQMPTLDGFEATRAIRANEASGPTGPTNGLQARRVPIVAVTANALATDRARCLECGMDDFLAKPLELESLREALTRHSRK